MANYEKQVEQEAAYPIPISLYNCYRTVRQEKRYQEYIDSYASLLLPHCPVTVVQRYRDGVCSLLFHLFFIICHPYIPLHLEEMIFYTMLNHIFHTLLMYGRFSNILPPHTIYHHGNLTTANMHTCQLWYSIKAWYEHESETTDYKQHNQ